MSSFKKALDLAVVFKSAVGIAGAIASPNKTPAKRAVDITYNMATAIKAGSALRSGPSDPTAMQQVTSPDVLFLASALLDTAFESRRKMDFSSTWRENMAQAVAQYMPPYDGFKAMMIRVIENGPMRIDPQYTEEVEALIKSYSLSPRGDGKDGARNRLYQMALASSQNFGFHRKPLVLGTDVVYAHIFRLKLEPGMLEYDVDYPTSNGKKIPALYRPGTYADLLVSEVPNVSMFINQAGEAVPAHLPSILAVSDTQELEIAYHWTSV